MLNNVNLKNSLRGRNVNVNVNVKQWKSGFLHCAYGRGSMLGSSQDILCNQYTNISEQKPIYYGIQSDSSHKVRVSVSVSWNTSNTMRMFDSVQSLEVNYNVYKYKIRSYYIIHFSSFFLSIKHGLCVIAQKLCN